MCQPWSQILSTIRWCASSEVCNEEWMTHATFKRTTGFFKQFSVSFDCMCHRHHWRHHWCTRGIFRFYYCAEHPISHHNYVMILKVRIMNYEDKIRQWYWRLRSVKNYQHGFKFLNAWPIVAIGIAHWASIIQGLLRRYNISSIG